MIESHQRYTVIAKRLPLHGEVAGWRGKQANFIPQPAERVGVVAGERIYIRGKNPAISS